MNRIKVNKKWSGALALMLVLFSSCKKEAPTLAKIKVIDENGILFQQAEVRVFGQPTIPPPNAMIIDKTLTSNQEGMAVFDFTQEFKLGQAGFTVLNIEVNSGDTLFGEGIIKIEEEKINAQTIVIQPL